MKFVLALIDFSETTESVIHYASEIASAFDAQLRLLHVTDPESDYDANTPRANVSRGAISAQLRQRRRAMKLLETVSAKRGISAKGMLVRTKSARGKSAPKILEEVARLKPDLIVLGSRGHSALYDLFLGSTSMKVLRKAGCPVLLVPQQPKRSARPGRMDSDR